VTEPPTVPAPEPPDAPDAWYAPEVRAQYEVRPGVVVTIRERERSGTEFEYAVREPSLVVFPQTSNSQHSPASLQRRCLWAG